MSGVNNGFWVPGLRPPPLSLSSSGVRPFGVSLLVIGLDAQKGPSLYQVDPSVSVVLRLSVVVGLWLDPLLLIPLPNP